MSFAVVWPTRTTVFQLTVPSGATASAVWAGTPDGGVLVGSWTDSANSQHPCMWTGTGSRVLANLALPSLGTLTTWVDGISNAWADGISDDAQTISGSGTNISGDLFLPNHEYGFRWDGGGTSVSLLEPATNNDNTSVFVFLPDNVVGPAFAPGATNSNMFMSHDGSVIAGQSTAYGDSAGGGTVWISNSTPVLMNTTMFGCDSVDLSDWNSSPSIQAFPVSACSANGTTLAGAIYTWRTSYYASYWKDGIGYVLAPLTGSFATSFSYAVGTNGDGSMIYGYTTAYDPTYTTSNTTAVYWDNVASQTVTTSETILVYPEITNWSGYGNVHTIPNLGYDSQPATLSAFSLTGNVAVGYARDPSGVLTGFKFDGTQNALPVLVTGQDAAAFCCSGDGSVVAGYAWNGPHTGDSPGQIRPVYWDSTSSIHMLPSASTGYAVGVSRDGSTIWGWTDIPSGGGPPPQEAFVYRVTTTTTPSETITPQILAARSFGFGGLGGMKHRYALSYYSGSNAIVNPCFANTTTYLTGENLVNGHVQVIANAVLQPTSAYIVNTTGLSLNVTFPDDADLAVVAWDSSISNTCLVHTQTLNLSDGVTVSDGMAFTLQNPDTETLPAHAGTIVEIEGVRILPPLTYYGAIDHRNRHISMDFSISSGTVVDLMIDGTYYANVAVPRWSSVSPSPNGHIYNLIPGAAPSSSVPGGFVLYQNYLVATDSSFFAKEVAAVFYETSKMQYRVSGDQVVIMANLAASPLVTVTTFSHASLMGIKTYTHFTNENPIYRISSPVPLQYSMVSVNGRMLVPEMDYDMTEVIVREHVSGTTYTADRVVNSLTIPGDTSPTNSPIITTIFTGEKSKLPSKMRVATTTPDRDRMRHTLSGGWDEDRFDASFVEYDREGVWDYDYIPFSADGNPVQVYQMDDRWEYSAHTVFNSGNLANAVTPDANTITVNIAFGELDPKYWPIQLVQVGSNWEWSGAVFGEPDHARDVPGAVWIGKERIEYMSLDFDPPSYVYSNGVSAPTICTPPQIILGSLRRGTRGTSTIQERRVSEGFLATGTTSTFTVNAVGTVELKVSRNTAGSVEWKTYLAATPNAVTIANTITSTDHHWPMTNDYTVNTTSNTTVHLSTVPPAGAYVSIGVTIDYSHPAGTLVADDSIGSPTITGADDYVFSVFG